MKVTPIIFAVFCVVGAMTLITATTLEQAPHPSEKDMELVYIDAEYEKEGGLKSICNEIKRSFRKGRHHIYKVMDKYIRKEDLGMKMLDVAKILGRRIEKRMEYIAKKLDKMMEYESS
uniref:SPO-1 protein n=3 Tax=Schistosoma mansoni TaxID=6183 RepID=O77234_SCHMA|nr:stathmin-like protein [Schistosoma mansoni]AAD26122.1 SPO-1 protein [Schistosoma mansoni]AAD26535.1 stage-specific protein SPO-1 [Schistosoma mansoni]